MGCETINNNHPVSKGYYGFQISHRLQELAVYCQVDSYETQADGNIILTREDGWNEVKLGHIFKSINCLHAEGKQGWVN